MTDLSFYRVAVQLVSTRKDTFVGVGGVLVLPQVQVFWDNWCYRFEWNLFARIWAFLVEPSALCFYPPIHLPLGSMLNFHVPFFFRDSIFGCHNFLPLRMIKAFFKIGRVSWLSLVFLGFKISFHVCITIFLLIPIMVNKLQLGIFSLF